jgi:hypothetical protein
MTHLNSRVARIVAGLAVVSAFAVAPMAAQAATDTTDATGTLGAGALSITAPDITGFGTKALTGVNQEFTTDVGGWSVTDATGGNDGYTITAEADAPTVVGGTAGTGGTLTLGVPAGQASADAGNPAADGPLHAVTAQLLTSGAATIDTAITNTGQGKWDFAGAADGLSVVIPGDASAGAYSSTLTYTIAGLV